MKIKIPAKTVEACDICQHEGCFLRRCLVCQREFCLTCQAIMAGCMIQPKVCKECDDRDDVRAVVERYSHDFVKTYKLRDKALGRLLKTKT